MVLEKFRKAHGSLMLKSEQIQQIPQKNNNMQVRMKYMRDEEACTIRKSVLKTSKGIHFKYKL
jgi:hypothetical protein